jgi:hypothetical protein
MRSIAALQTWRKRSLDSRDSGTGAGKDKIPSFPASLSRGGYALQPEVSKNSGDGNRNMVPFMPRPLPRHRS